jgi:hypothetical protein
MFECFGPIRQPKPAHVQRQMGLITGDQVINSVIADPQVAELATIKSWVNPRNELHERLKVAVVEDTSLIRVSLSLPSPDDAVTIVQSVVSSYLAQNAGYQGSANRDLAESLKQQLMRIRTEIDFKRWLIKGLNKKGKVKFLRATNGPNAIGNEGHDLQPRLEIVPDDNDRKMLAAIEWIELELIEATSVLDVKRAYYEAMREEIQQPTQQADRQQLARASEQFQQDPYVLGIMQELEEARERLEFLERNPRQFSDAAKVAAQNQFNALKQEYHELWQSEYPKILNRLKAGLTSEAHSFAAILELDRKVESLKEKKAILAEIFKVIQVEQQAKDGDAFELSFVSRQAQKLASWEEMVTKNLDQLRLDLAEDEYHVVLVDPASAPRTPSNASGGLYSVAAPTVVFFLLFGLLLVREARTIRSVDNSRQHLA